MYNSEQNGTKVFDLGQNRNFLWIFKVAENRDSKTHCRAAEIAEKEWVEGSSWPKTQTSIARSELCVLWLRSTLVRAETCLRDVLFSAVTMFEAKRKGYCFILYPFTVKVSPKSKNEGESGSILWNQNVLTWNTPSFRRCALSTSQIEEDNTNRFADFLVRRLKEDEIGVCVFPSKHARCVRATKLQVNLKVRRSKRKARYFSASVSLPVIFCSLTLAKTSVFSCKYNDYGTVFIRETERCNGKFSASTGSVQVLISLSRSVFSTAVHTKQNQSRLLKQSTFLVPWKPAKV